MKKLILLAAIFISLPVYADIEFQTHDSKGNAIATFSQITTDPAGLQWKAPDGTIWSSLVPGGYQNVDLGGTTPVRDKIQKSDATEKCRSLGKSLPTFTDFKNLQSYFELSPSGFTMTAQGLKDLETMFPGMVGRGFWSSTTGLHDHSGAYAFNAYFGSVEWVSIRHWPSSLVCITH